MKTKILLEWKKDGYHRYLLTKANKKDKDEEYYIATQYDGKLEWGRGDRK